MHAPVKRRRAHRGERPAQSAGEAVHRDQRIERRQVFLVSVQLRVHALHGAAQSDERVEHMQAGALEPAAGRFFLERAPAAGDLVRVLVAVVALDVQQPAELLFGENAFQRAHSRPEARSEEHTSELQSQSNLVCRLLLEKKTAHLAPHPSQSTSTRASTMSTSRRAHASPMPPPASVPLPTVILSHPTSGRTSPPTSLSLS